MEKYQAHALEHVAEQGNLEKSLDRQLEDFTPESDAEKTQKIAEIKTALEQSYDQKETALSENPVEKDEPSKETPVKRTLLNNKYLRTATLWGLMTLAGFGAHSAENKSGSKKTKAENEATTRSIKTSKGILVTYDQWQTSRKNDMSFNLKEYADWVNSWAGTPNSKTLSADEAMQTKFSLATRSTSHIKEITPDQLAFVKFMYPQLTKPTPMSNVKNTEYMFNAEQSDIIRSILTQQEN